MKIRKAEPGDAEAIARVHVDSWKTTYRGIILDEVLDKLSYEKRMKMWSEILLMETKDSFVYVAENDVGKVIGFVTGGTIRKKVENYTGELYSIYLLQEYQFKGIGTKLVSTLVKSLLDIKINNMIVWFLAENKSRLFYEKLGGVKVCEGEETVGKQKFTSWAYGWTDIRKILKSAGKIFNRDRI